MCARRTAFMVWFACPLARGWKAVALAARGRSDTSRTSLVNLSVIVRMASTSSSDIGRSVTKSIETTSNRRDGSGTGSGLLKARLVGGAPAGSPRSVPRGPPRRAGPRSTRTCA